MKISIIKRYKKLIIVIVLFLLAGILYSYAKWDSYLELDREEREFVDAALSGIGSLQFGSRSWEENENMYYYGFYSKGPDRLETFNELRENINRYWASHPEGELVKHKVVIHIEHIHNQGPLIAFYNYNGSAENPQHWQALLNTRVKDTDIIESPESLICLADCIKLGFDYYFPGWEIIKHFKDLKSFKMPGLKEEEKEKIQNLLPGCTIYSSQPIENSSALSLSGAHVREKYYKKSSTSHCGFTLNEAVQKVPRNNPITNPPWL